MTIILAHLPDKKENRLVKSVPRNIGATQE